MKTTLLKAGLLRHIGKSMTHNGTLFSTKQVTQKITPPLATIVFIENPFDDITPRVLHDLTPRLNKMGYNCFLDEYPATLDKRLANTLKAREFYSALTDFFARFGWNISNPSNVEYVINKIILRGRNLDGSQLDCQVISMYVEQILDAILKKDANNIYYSFYMALKKLHFAYEGVNIPPDKECKADNDYSKSIHSCESYVTKMLASQQAFGRIDVNNALRIQYGLYDYKDSAAGLSEERFEFMHVFSDYAKADSRIINTVDRYPLGVTVIDGRNYAEDQKYVLNQILYRIREKNKELAELAAPDHSPRPK